MPHRQKTCHMRKYLLCNTWKDGGMLYFTNAKQTKHVLTTASYSPIFRLSLSASLPIYTDSGRMSPNFLAFPAKWDVRFRYFRFDKITELFAERGGKRSVCRGTLQLFNRDVLRKLNTT
jgi:hypothetical protein